MLELIQSWADRVADDPVRLVEKLFSEFAAWAKQSRWRGSGFTRAAMEFAGSPGHPARKAASRHKASVEGWLAQQFATGGIRESQLLARKDMLLLEGCHSLVLIHGESNYADAASKAASLIVKSAIASEQTNSGTLNPSQTVSISPSVSLVAHPPHKSPRLNSMAAKNATRTGASSCSQQSASSVPDSVRRLPASAQLDRPARRW